MPSLIDIRRRIRSVKNTQQITKAMRMVAAAKLRRAQDRVIAARPYAGMLERILANVAAAARGSEAASENPLLQVREEKRVLLVLLTADRGLAGAFNTNIIKGAQSFLGEFSGKSVEIEAIGRKGRDFFRRREVKFAGELIGVSERPSYGNAASISRKIIERYAAGEVDAVYLINNNFQSVLVQRLSRVRILPLPEAPDHAAVDYIYEQPPEQLLAALLPRYLEVALYRAMLESAAAEFASRMTAMEAASRNAAEVIDKLTLYMNRVRQASITKEIIEVVSGASALE